MMAEQTEMQKRDMLCDELQHAIRDAARLAVIRDGMSSLERMSDGSAWRVTISRVEGTGGTHKLNRSSARKAAKVSR